MLHEGVTRAKGLGIVFANARDVPSLFSFYEAADFGQWGAAAHLSQKSVEIADGSVVRLAFIFS
jgi:hypothetical protein